MAKKMSRNHIDEDRDRLFDTLDEIKREIAVLKTEVSLIKKVVVGNGQQPLEKRLSTLESELNQIQSQSAKSWQFIVAMSAAIGYVLLTFMLHILR